MKLVAAKRLAHNCLPLSTLGISTLLMFAVFGPVLSSRSNVGHAIIVIYCTSYLISISTIIYLWFNRPVFGLSPGQLFKIGLELVFCPFLMANIVKKVSWQCADLVNVTDLIKNFSGDAEAAMTVLRSNLQETSISLESR